MKSPKICIVVGTRPEVIKQVSLYWACQETFGKEKIELLSTGQHRQLLDQALAHFSCETTDDLRLMQSNQTLNSLSGTLMTSFDGWLREHNPDLVIVQGDTSTAAMTAICAFNLKIKVAHNEAGLRSYDLQNPFPEEANRRWISAVADFNFAPTERAKQALLSERISEEKIFVTGNTGIDSLFWTLDQPCPAPVTDILKEFSAKNLKPVLLTAHRRESTGAAIESWFDSLRHFLEANPELGMIYPVHPNQMSKEALDRHLKNHPRIMVMPPLEYGSLCHLLSKCFFVVTDSGGIQEEAATLGIPTVVCRETTERQEAIEAGFSVLAGFGREKILNSLNWAAQEAKTSKKRTFLFGNGQSGKIIARILKGYFE